MAQKKAPLTGFRIIVGRARHQAGALSSGLRGLGAEVTEIPFIEIRKPRSYKPLDAALKNLHQYDWLILTSVNGVEALWQRLNKLRLTKRQLKHLKIAAIGPATRKAIEKHGLKVNVVPEEYVAESVVEALRNEVAGKLVLLARARVARDVIPRELRKLGAEVDVVEAYETVIPPSSRYAACDDSERFETSSRRDRVYKFVNGQKLRRTARKKSAAHGICLASIGPVTSSTLRDLGLPVDVEATEYTIPGLIKALSGLEPWSLTFTACMLFGGLAAAQTGQRSLHDLFRQ